MVFPNARRHQEMQTAIENDIGKGMQYVWGQIWFSESSKKADGSLIFERLDLHQNLTDQDKAVNLLKTVISPDYIDSDFRVKVL